MELELVRTNEMDALCERIILVIDEIGYYEKKAQQFMIAAFVFGIIGIFFFPCLIVAGLIYCLRRWCVARANDFRDEIEKLNTVPNLVEYVRQYYGPQTKNP